MVKYIAVPRYEGKLHEMATLLHRRPKNAKELDDELWSLGLKWQICQVLESGLTVAKVDRLVAWPVLFDDELKVVAQFRQHDEPKPYGNGGISWREATFRVEEDWPFGPISTGSGLVTYPSLPFEMVVQLTRLAKTVQT